MSGHPPVDMVRWFQNQPEIFLNSFLWHAANVKVSFNGCRSVRNFADLVHLNYVGHSTKITSLVNTHFYCIKDEIFYTLYNICITSCWLTDKRGPTQPCSARGGTRNTPLVTIYSCLVNNIIYIHLLNFKTMNDRALTA